MDFPKSMIENKWTIPGTLQLILLTFAISTWYIKQDSADSKIPELIQSQAVALSDATQSITKMQMLLLENDRHYTTELVEVHTQLLMLNRRIAEMEQAREAERVRAGQ